MNTKTLWPRSVLLAVVASTLMFAEARAGIPDAWITTKSKIAVLSAVGTAGTAINVDTVNGLVTLHGKVASMEDSVRAEKAARSVEGVTQVQNLLQVVPLARDAAVTRSDMEIKEHAESALRADPALRDASITVQSVNDGTVLLGGQATDLAQHARAIEVVRQAEGVRAVRTEIESPQAMADAQLRAAPGKVAQTTSDAGRHVATVATDLWITSATKTRLLADRKTPGMDIDVDARDGAVTLFGMVPSMSAKAQAEAEAKKVSGVKQVVNELEVVPSDQQPKIKAQDEAVEHDIERAVRDNRQLRKTSIEVDVINGVARVTGTVPSEEKKLTALATVKGVAGVRTVKDGLEVRTN